MEMNDLFGNEVIEQSFEEPKTKKLNLFKDFIPDLMNKKNNILKTIPNSEKDLSPFMINLVMSQHLDCLMFANEMNKASTLPKQLQYDFYIHSIRKGFRSGWEKKSRIDNIELIMKHFQLNESKAKVSLTLLSDEDISNIESLYETGGRTK